MAPDVLGQFPPGTRHGASVSFPEHQSSVEQVPTGPHSADHGPGLSTIHAATARIDAARMVRHRSPRGEGPVPDDAWRLLLSRTTGRPALSNFRTGRRSRSAAAVA
jgi:hypothetical protein